MALICASSFLPVMGVNPRLLILGSLPSPRSLGEGRYYAHPRNAFWPIVCRALGEALPKDFDERYELIASRGIALWDVAASAVRDGSADSAIRAEIPNDIPALLASRPTIKRILFNGSASFALYKRHFGEPPIPYARLLSTSPACAGRSAEREAAWRSALSESLA